MTDHVDHRLDGPHHPEDPRRDPRLAAIDPRAKRQRQRQWEADRAAMAQRLGCSEQDATELLYSLPYSTIPSWGDLSNVLDCIAQMDADRYRVVLTPRLRVTVAHDRLHLRAEQ